MLTLILVKKKKKKLSLACVFSQLIPKNDNFIYNKKKSLARSNLLAEKSKEQLFNLVWPNSIELGWLS